MFDHRRPHDTPESVNAYWDAAARGEWPDPTAPIATTIRQLSERARTPDPSPAFIAELEATLMHAATLQSVELAPTRHDSQQPGGVFPGAPDRSRGGTRRFSMYVPALQILAAAVLLLALIGGGLVSGLIRQPLPIATRPPQLPALEALPEAATPQPDLLGQGVIAREVWETSENQGAPLHDPFGVGIDPQGKLWVTNEHTNSFAIFSPDGTPLETWGTPGAGDGQFSTPEDIAFAPDGTFYVADAGNHRVQQFAPDRSFVRAWSAAASKSGPLATAEVATSLSNPVSIKVGPDGSVYVSDDARNVVERYSADGQWLNSLGGEVADLDQPNGIAIAPDGTVWVADFGHGRLKVFTPDGDYLRAVGKPGAGPGMLSLPAGVAFDPAGRLYVTDSYRVQIFDPSLQLIGHTRRGAGGYSSQVEVELGPDGRIYTTDYMLGIVSAFDLLQPVPAAAPDAPVMPVELAPTTAPPVDMPLPAVG